MAYPVLNHLVNSPPCSPQAGDFFGGAGGAAVVLHFGYVYWRSNKLVVWSSRSGDDVGVAQVRWFAMVVDGSVVD